MAAITAATGANDWNTNGAWVGAVQPTAADDVTIPASASVNIPSGVTALGRSVTNQASGTIIFAATSSLLNIGDGTAGAGNVAFSNAGTITLTAVGVITFKSTSATQQTITTGGSTMPSMTFNGSGGSWLLSDALTGSGTGVLAWTAGTFNSGNQTIVFGSCTTNSGTKTITLGSSTITFSLAGTAMSMSNAGTLTANTAQITLSGASAIMAGGGSNGGGATIIFTGGGTNSYNGNSTTNYSVTVTGTAAKTNIFNSNATSGSSINTLTINGQSATNRILWQCVTVGTNWPCTITTLAAGSNYDVMDINLAGGASPADISGITGGSGDCGGNTNFTFTTPVSRYAVVAGNWSATATWSTTDGGAGGASVPLSQDTAYFTVNSAAGSYSMDMPRPCKDLDCTGFTRTITHGTQTFLFGSFTLAPNMTFTSLGQTFAFYGRGTHTITMAGKTISETQTFVTSGTYTFQDAYKTGSTASTSVSGTATLNFNGQLFTMKGLSMAGNGTLNLGASTFDMFDPAPTWNISNGTVNCGTSKIIYSSTTTATRTFTGGGKAYNSVVFYATPDHITLAGTANTYNDLRYRDPHLLENNYQFVSSGNGMSVTEGIR